MSTEPTASESDGGSITIDQQLIEEGTHQLSCEIEVLEAWLVELEEQDARDAETIAMRKSYDDMLRSRKEMLNSLTKQAARQAVAG